MCLSPDGYKRALWGDFKELCKILGNQSLPKRYQKLTSAQIGVRTRIGFTGELSILFESYTDLIIDAVENDSVQGERLVHELEGLAYEFRRMSEHFGKASQVAEEVHHRCGEKVYVKNRMERLKALELESTD